MNAHDKEIEQAVSKAVKQAGTVTPTIDFTKNVMQAIAVQQEKASTTLKYKPLISKKVWFGIAALLALIILSSVFVRNDYADSVVLSELSQVVSLPKISLPRLSLEVPSSLVLGISLIAAFLCIEMPLLRKYYDRS